MLWISGLFYLFTAVIPIGIPQFNRIDSKEQEGTKPSAIVVVTSLEMQ